VSVLCVLCCQRACEDGQEAERKKYLVHDAVLFLGVLRLGGGCR
jgi:hypothetical protein